MKNIWLLNIVSFAVFPLWFLLFYEWFGLSNANMNGTLFTCLTFALLFAHEAIHSVTIRLLNPTISIRYGYRPPFTMYVRIVGNMTLYERVIFLLAPLCFLTVVFCVLSFLVPEQRLLWITLASINASGSVSDIWRSVQALRPRLIPH